MLIMIMVTAAAGVCAAAELPAPDNGPEAIRRIERRWRRIERCDDRMGCRDLFGASLLAAALDRWPEKVEHAMGLAEQMQDRDAGSRTYGNFKWYWGAEKPIDRNAVEFCMHKGVLIWKLYRDRLTATAAERLERLMAYSVAGILRHRVRDSYTNIFLMKTFNCIALGEALGREELADFGYRLLDRWLMYTAENGIHEYISPTYYGVDLDCLGLIARFAGRAAGREKAAAGLRMLWTDIAANYWPPCRRLCGAHSRDYDYLTGRGYLDHHLAAAGFGGVDRHVSYFTRLAAWDPPREIRDLSRRLPRTVRQRWGAGPGQRAVNYVCRDFSIGSSGAAYGPMDKPLTINFTGGPRQVMVNFFMDARGDPYGKKKFARRSGHRKVLHVKPFIASVQRGPEVLLLAAAKPPFRYIPAPTCLRSHLVVPLDATVWIEDKKLASDDTAALKPGQNVFLKYNTAGAGIRFLHASAGGGTSAALRLVSDGKQYGARRLTAVHTEQEPQGRHGTVLWIRAAGGLDAAAFATFREQFRSARHTVETDGDRIRAEAEGLEEKMVLAANLAARRTTAIAGAEPGAEATLLAIDGRDHGREILSEIDCVGRYLRMLADSVDETKTVGRAGEIVEAESAAMIVPTFRTEKDPQARGGRFAWVPPSGQCGGPSAVARLVWPLEVPKAGNYRLYARVIAPDGEHDSFFVRIRQAGRDALPVTDWHTGRCHEWEWTRLKTGKKGTSVTLEEGTAVLEIRCREAGTKLDALLLTDGPNGPAGL